MNLQVLYGQQSNSELAFEGGVCSTCTYNKVEKEAKCVNTDSNRQYDHQNKYRLGEKGTTGEQESGDTLHPHRSKKTSVKILTKLDKRNITTDRHDCHISHLLISCKESLTPLAF